MHSKRPHWEAEGGVSEDRAATNVCRSTKEYMQILRIHFTGRTQRRTQKKKRACTQWECATSVQERLLTVRLHPDLSSINKMITRIRIMIESYLLDSIG